MSNYSILQHNTLYGLSETAGILYLRLCDQYRDERRAFLEADRYDNRCGEVLHKVLYEYPGFAEIPQQVKTDLSRFMSERWRNNFIEGA